MASTYTVDASVFLNAFNRYEAGYPESHQFLALLQERAIPIIVPFLLLPEVAAAVRRGRGDARLARRFVAALSQLPHLVLVPLEETLAAQSAQVAADHAMRGSDAVYAAVALRFGSTLVTLDREQYDRAAGLVPALLSAEALAGVQSQPL